MIQLTPHSRIFVATEPVDFRQVLMGEPPCVASAWATTRSQAPCTSFETAPRPR